MPKLIYVVFILLATVNTYAQETVYFKKDTKTKSSKKKNNDMEQIVKVSPLSFIAGFIPVYYERSVNETFSVQLGAGITTTNYIKDALRYAQGNQNNDVKSTKWNTTNTNNTYFNENNNEQYKNRETKMGYYVSLEPRVYFNSEGLEGSFMGLSVSNARYNINSKKVATTNNNSGQPIFTNNIYKGNETITDFFVNFGTQTLYDKISLEYHFGLGLRKITGKEYAFAQDFLSSSSMQKYVEGESTLNKTKVGFNVSIKVGYQF